MLVTRLLQDRTLLRGRFSLAVYPAEMDHLVRDYGLEEAEKALPPLRVVREKNLVVLAGRNLLRNFLCGDVVTGFERYAIGTSSTAAAAGNTTLGTEVFRAVPTQKIKSDGVLTIKIYVASTEANGNTLREAGVFCNGATATANSGTLYARVVHSAVVKTAAVAIVYSHDLIFAAG